MKLRVNIAYLFIGLGIIVGISVLIYVYNFFKLKDPDNGGITRIFFVDNISPAHQKLIRQFNTEFAGEIEVVPINVPFTKFSTNERKELLARSLRSKSDRIDVFAVDLIWVPRFARWAEPLDRYIPINKRATILKDALQSCYNGKGQLVAVPFYIDIGMMYYRKDLLSALPDYPRLAERLKQSITWEEFLRLHDRLPRKDVPYFLFPAKNYEGLVCSFVELVASQGASFFQGDSLQLNTPAARKAVQLLVDLVHKYKFTPPEVTEFDETQTYRYALAHDGVFFRGWPAFVREFNVAHTPKMENIEPAALPHFKQGKPVSVFGGWNLMLSRFSTKKTAAMKFIHFIMRRESQELMFREGGYLPVNTEVYQDSQFVSRFPELRYYRRLLQHGVHRPYLIDYTKVSDVISYYIHSAIKGSLSVEEALKRATQIINSREVFIR